MKKDLIKRERLKKLLAVLPAELVWAAGYAGMNA